MPAPGVRWRSLRSSRPQTQSSSSESVVAHNVPAMRGYHIRITLAPPSLAPGPSSATTSTSYKHTPSISVSSSSSSSPFAPSSLFQPLPSHAPRYAARRNTLSVYSAPEKDKSTEKRARRDCRLGPIRVDWVDFSDMDVPGAAFIKVGSGKERDRSAQKKGAYSVSSAHGNTPTCCAPGEPATATFVPHTPAHSKSGTTNLPEGVVHIFRDYPSSPDGAAKGATYASAVSNASTAQPDEPPSETHPNNVESDDVTLAVLAVPSWMTPSDFLAFVAPAADGISHLRMIRLVSRPPALSVLLRQGFRKADCAIGIARQIGLLW